MAFTLPPGMAGMFGYGSLLLRSSMERTLGRPYSDPPVAATIRGWRRTWDSIYPNGPFYFEQASGERCHPKHIIYLNIRRDPATVLNGLIYVVNADDLARFDEREAVYDRIRIDDDIVTPDVSGGPVYVYVGRPGFVLEAPVPNTEAAIRASYIKIVEDGLNELGPDFRRDYERSSDVPPAASIVDDRRS